MLRELSGDAARKRDRIARQLGVAVGGAAWIGTRNPAAMALPFCRKSFPRPKKGPGSYRRVKGV